MNVRKQMKALATTWLGAAQRERDELNHPESPKGRVYQAVAVELIDLAESLPSTPADHAVAALREAADALDAIPDVLRLETVERVVAPNMRYEADHIERVVDAAIEAAREPSQ